MRCSPWCTDLLCQSLLVLVSVHLISGELCASLDGTWYNTLGSEMILSHSSDGLLSGEYRTAVERSAGAAGSSHSLIKGAAPYNSPRSPFGFSVSWRGGRSTTGWTGQCHVCNGQEVLMTTWMLRSIQDSCLDKWKSTLIGHDYFFRTEQREGPRKADDTHTPQDVSGRRKRHTKEYQGAEPGLFQSFRRRRRDAGNNGVRVPCSLDGRWYNDVGSELHLTPALDGTITGKYQTKSERTTGKMSGKHSDIYGVTNVDMANSTFAFFIIWNQGASVTGWVGQCHICTEEGGEVEIMETTWLHRNMVPGCDENWRSTLYGQNSFRRQEWMSSVAEGESAGEFGDALVDLLCLTSAASMVMFSKALLLVLVLYCLGVLSYMW